MEEICKPTLETLSRIKAFESMPASGWDVSINPAMLQGFTAGAGAGLLASQDLARFVGVEFDRADVPDSALSSGVVADSISQPSKEP